MNLQTTKNEFDDRRQSILLSSCISRISNNTFRILFLQSPLFHINIPHEISASFSSFSLLSKSASISSSSDSRSLVESKLSIQGKLRRIMRVSYDIPELSCNISSASSADNDPFLDEITMLVLSTIKLKNDLLLSRNSSFLDHLVFNFGHDIFARV